MRPDSPHMKGEWPLYVLVLSLLGYALSVLYQANVMEDAYITLRVIDNFVAGHGLRWNLDERVQVYTHPLWMLVHLPLYALWPDPFGLMIVTGVVCSMAAIFFLMLSSGAHPLRIAGLLMLPLALSPIYTIFSTSGFENPMTHLLFALWIYCAVWCRERVWLMLTLFAALSAMNRFDTVIFFAPMMGWALWVHGRRLRVGQVLLGVMPLAAWAAFAVFYYGFFFPNTKYAKLNTGVVQSDYFLLGQHYFMNIPVQDAIAALVMIAASLLLPWLLWRAKKGDMRAGLVASVVAGSLCYHGYVWSVGGTYITGRFSTLPMVASAWCLLMASEYVPKLKLWPLAVSICVLRLMYVPQPLMMKMCPPCYYGVHWIEGLDVVRLRDVLTGKAAPVEMHKNTPQKKVLVGGSMGQWGFAMPREVIIVDYIALTDALLARLPINRHYLYSTGNLPRNIPVGYLHARETGDTSQMDPDLAHYYIALRRIVHDDLFDAERLDTLWQFHMGAYDDSLRRYIDKIIVRRPPQ